MLCQIYKNGGSVVYKSYIYHGIEDAKFQNLTILYTTNNVSGLVRLTILLCPPA